MKDLIGKKVILNPKDGRDAFDLFLRGKTAVVESIEEDLENRVYAAVVLETDAGKDLGMDKKIAHRFFFDLDELKIVEEF